MDSTRASSLTIGPLADLALALVATVGVILLLTTALDAPGLMALVCVVLFAGQSALVLGHWPLRTSFGWANRTTLLRSVLVLPLVAWAPFLASAGPAALWVFAITSLLALILDGVDGKVARATNSHSAFGARFDMELDALFILGLSIAVLALNKASFWVLLLGLMRYGFVAASAVFTWLDRPLPESFRRKTVCVWQVVTLMIAVMPVTPALFASATLGIALALLAWSFLVDIRWLHSRRFDHEN